MDSNLIGYIAIAVAIFLGFIGIAVAIFFGLRAFRTGIMSELSVIKERISELSVIRERISELSVIKERIIVIQETVQSVWDVAKRSPIFRATGTVERNLKNLGKIRITAEPHSDTTIYFIEVRRPVFDSALIDKLSKETGLAQREMEIFGGNVPGYSSPLPHQLIVKLPSTEPSVCTKYMNLFLKWLDSTYLESAPKIEDFEEPIQV